MNDLSKYGNNSTITVKVKFRQLNQLLFIFWFLYVMRTKLKRCRGNGQEALVAQLVRALVL